MNYAEGKGEAVKQTHGSRTQPINGSQNKRIKVKLNEQNANSCLLPRLHHSNIHIAVFRAKVRMKQIWDENFLKSCFCRTRVLD